MKFDDSTISKNISVATEFFKAYQAVKINYKESSKGHTYPGGITGFIPFNIEFTLDGISGIKIYDKMIVDSSFLPPNYPLSLEFIVTGVNHAIKDGDWETSIKITLIPKFDETPEPITAQDANIVTYKLPPMLTPTTVSSNINYDGPGYDPIRSVIISGESVGGSYDSLFPSTTYKTAFGKSALETTIAEVVANTNVKYVYGKNGESVSERAVGRYQNLPSLITQRAIKSGLDPKTSLFSEENQEKMFITLINEKTNNYFTKGGSQNELTTAVQGLSQTWTSMPTIKNQNGVTVGNVVNGDSNKAYYVSGVNAKDKKYNVATVVKALIKTYINLNKKQPEYVPSYITT